MTVSLSFDSAIGGQPAGSAAAPSRPGADASAHQEWLREMERAQQQAWKIPAVAAQALATRSGGAAIAQTGMASAPASATPSSWPSSTASALDAPNGALTASSGNAPGPNASVAAAVSATAVVGAVAAVVCTGADQPAAASSADAIACAASVQPTRHADAGAPRNPVRVSMQETADGLQVWMGVDASVAEAAPELVRQLLAGLSQQGIRPARVVCNGTLLHESAATTRHPVAPTSPQ